MLSLFSRKQASVFSVPVASVFAANHVKARGLGLAFAAAFPRIGSRLCWAVALLAIRLACSSVATAQTAQPVFSVESGTYTTPQVVGISDATAGATIYYTTDGNTPTTSSFVYAGPIPITYSETINAVAGGGAHTLSSVATATYTISDLTPIITTVAGDGTVGYSGDNGPATSAELNNPFAVVADGGGNFYIADYSNSVVRKVTTAGKITTIAGNGTAGYSGDEGPATSAELTSPAGLALDSSGNLYIGDRGNNTVRKVTPAGVISTVAGNGTGGYSGDNGPATSAELNAPYGVIIDASDNLYIAEYSGQRVRKVTHAGTITTIAGNGTAGYSGDDGPAASATLNGPLDVAIDLSGNLYIADAQNSRVRMVNPSGTIMTVVGNGGSPGNGDGGPAISASVTPYGVAVDASGFLYIADTSYQSIRRVDQFGTISTVAGGNGQAYGGDAGPAFDAELNTPTKVSVDAEGNYYIADLNNIRIRKVTVSGVTSDVPIITWPTPAAIPYGTELSVSQLNATANVAGTFVYSLAFGTVLPLGSHTLSVIFTPTDTTYYKTTATVILQVNQATPTITWYTPAPILSGTALSATQLDAIANLPGTFDYAPAAGTVPPLGSQTLSVTFTPDDTVDYTTATAKVALKVIAPGSTPAQPVFSVFSVVDGAPNTPQVVTITDATPAATIYYTTDGSTPTINSFVYAGPIPITVSETINAVAGGGAYGLSPVATATYTLTGLTPIITTVAGNGTPSYSGDNGPATSAELNQPYSVLADGSGNFYIADYSNSAVRKVTPAGIISTIAGNGTAGYSGDDGPATSAELSGPAGLALDSSGNLYIGDRGNNTVRKVTPAGIISTVAGNGTAGYSGDDGPATSAELNAPYGLAFDAGGNLYIAEYSNQTVRKVTPAGTITTIAGNGTAGYTGDNGPATSATLNGPDDIAFDLSGNLYINDDLNSRIRMVNPSGTITTVVGNGGTPGNGDGGPAISATLGQPHGVTVDANGFLYIADTFDQSIRRVDQFGTITTVVGNGGAPGIGDGGPAFDAELNLPTKVSVDAVGNYYIADLGNYRIRKVNISGVPQSVPTISWPTPASIHYGTELSATQLDAAAGVQGTYSYNPPLGTVLTAGTHTLAVAFHPTDTTDYAPATATVKLQVIQATPIITWPTPASIPYGTALSGTQLDATANVQGAFAYTPTAGTVLPVGTQTLSVTFTPDDTTDYTTPTSTVQLVVNPVPAPSLSSTSLSFGSATIGTSTASQSITLTNTGGATLSITSIAVTGSNASSFVFSNSCGTSVAAGANCSIHGHFAPAASGALTAAITIADNASNSPQTIALSGTGVEPPVTLSVTSLSFGSVYLGLSSNPQTVTLTNTGTAALSITSIAVTGTDASSFVFANSCGTSLAVGANCTIQGNFAPTKAGGLTAAINITDSAATSPQTIALSGTGLEPVTLSATSLSFGSVTVGLSSTPQTMTLTNVGTATLSITSIAVTGANASSFVIANNCGTSLAAGANCTIHGHFAPATTGALTATVTITDSSPTSPQTIALSGTGLTPPVTLSVSSLSFGSATIGTATASQYVTLTNTGTAALSITSIAVTGADAPSFVFGNSCGTSLAVGGTCSIHGHFAPTKTGALTAAITITDSAATSPRTIALSGTGVAPPVTLSATSLSFGSITVGETSASQTVTLTNTGTADLSIASLAVTGANASSFVFANSCATSLAVGANCTFHGHFAPTKAGAMTAAITITDSASSSPQSVALTGTGVAPASPVTLSSTSLSFGSVSVGTASASQSVTMTNSGNVALSITSIAVTGADASSFVFANSCGTSLAIGASCTIHGHFAPAAAGALTAAITITDSAPNSPQTITLSGTGINPLAALSATSPAFGRIIDNTSAESQTVTFTNVGASALDITSIAVTGTCLHANLISMNACISNYRQLMQQIATVSGPG